MHGRLCLVACAVRIAQNALRFTAVLFTKFIDREGTKGTAEDFAAGKTVVECDDTYINIPIFVHTAPALCPSIHSVWDFFACPCLADCCFAFFEYHAFGDVFPAEFAWTTVP